MSWTGVVVVLAVGVALKPASVARLMALLATFTLELAIGLPDVFNHVLIVGFVGGAILVWWLVALTRSRDAAMDPGCTYGAIGPFLRVAFVVVMYAAAFSKLNTGFLNPVTTCAVWILDSIPLLTVPSSLAPLPLAGTIIMEFAIPTLLIARRTRILAVFLGVAFGIVTATAGHAPFAGFGWTFYLLFIPPGTLGRVVVSARRMTRPLRRRPGRATLHPLIAWAAAAAVALAVMALVQAAPGGFVAMIKGRGASLAFDLWVLAWTFLLAAHWRHWLHSPPGPSAKFGTGSAVFAIALAVLLVNAASPYLGLKTRYSFTMFSNIQTEPGRWNHLIVPEAVRIFDAQAGLVRFDEISDPNLAAEVAVYSGADRWIIGPLPSESAWVVLVAAQRLASRYPDATIRYEYDGIEHIASPASSDPILGVPVGPIVQKLGGFRPLDESDTCQL